jgi:Ca2+-binding EF-hand superfamily protein
MHFPPQIQEMMDQADKDGTNSLDIIEFLQLMREKQKELTKEDEIADAFSVFDVVSP